MPQHALAAMLTLGLLLSVAVATDPQYMNPALYIAHSNFQRNDNGLPAVSPGLYLNYTSYFEGSNLHKAIEWDEWILATAFVRHRHTIMEFGARFGSTSCVLAKYAHKVISFEPDASVYPTLERNIRVNRCNVDAVKGILAESPAMINRPDAGYGTSSQYVKGGTVPNFYYKDVAGLLGAKVNALLIDCEGCIMHILQGANAAILDDVRLILIEHDQGELVEGGYVAVFELFKKAGFRQVWHTQDTYDSNADWSRTLQHSAWQKFPLRIGEAAPTCEEFAAKHSLSATHLICLPLL